MYCLKTELAGSAIFFSILLSEILS